MKSLAPLFVLALALTPPACADAERGDAVTPAPEDGKADASDRVSLLGPLGLGAAVTGTFREDLEWHGYTFAVRPDARVSLEITQKGSSRALDTTIFLFGPKSAAGAYGTSATASDDDAGWGRLSRLRGQRLAGGEWLVVVGTHDGRGRGNYRLELRCDSGECAPLEPEPTGACHPAILAGIDACVTGWLEDPDFDPSTVARADLIAQCADVEPMAPVRDRLCDGADAPAALCALDMERFALDYLPVCRHAAVGAYLDGACVFGERYRDLFEGNAALTVLSRRRLTDPSALGAGEVAQVLSAVRATAHEPTTIEEAFEVVDGHEVNQTELWDASNRKAYTAYEVGAGDNSFGKVFVYGTTTEVARDNDGDWYDCKVTWGPERRECTADAQCAVGRCAGSSDASPLGRCLDGARDDHPDEGVDCSDASACPGGSGLVCAGAARDGAGMCLPAWMRGRFGSAPALAIPDAAAGAPGEAARAQVLVYGLATVDMDVVLDLYVTHPRPQDLRVTLTNPAGTTVVVHDGAAATAPGEIVLRGKALAGFSGDEQVNGVWTVEATDTKRGEVGTLESFTLEITSRWD